jgi:hypothetical protein
METPQVIDKIKKLLASAGQKDNANEAAAAFARAQALATKHRIELAEIQLSTDAQEADPMVQETFAASSGVRVMGWKKALLFGMQTPLGVYCLFFQGRAEFTIVGKQADVQTAAYLYQAISAEIERLAARLAQGRGAGYANAFKLGATKTVVSRLHAAHAETMQAAQASGASSTALACVAQGYDAGKAWYAATGEKVRTIGSYASCSSAAGLAAGQEAGKSIDIGGKRGALGRGNRALPA